MDPITGLSRRALIGLAVAAVVGVVASTIAGSIATRGQPGCPDVRYRCATFEPGEPIVVGALFPDADGPESRALRAAVEEHGSLLGRAVQVASFGTGCTPEGAADGARELATDPPDGPPVVAVIGGACPAAAVPAAQILSDSGITLLLPASVTVPPTAGPVRYTLPVIPDSHPSSIAEAGDVILGTATDLALESEEERILIPRTPLRDALARTFGAAVR